MNNDLLAWLQEWYFAQCGDEDEFYKNYDHEKGKNKEFYQWGYGVKIDTIDNPGWDVRIDLRMTSLETKPFEGVSMNTEIANDDIDWYLCCVQDGVFIGTGGPLYLTKIIEIFREWATE